MAPKKRKSECMEQKHKKKTKTKPSCMGCNSGEEKKLVSCSCRDRKICVNCLDEFSCRSCKSACCSLCYEQCPRCEGRKALVCEKCTQAGKFCVPCEKARSSLKNLAEVAAAAAVPVASDPVAASAAENLVSLSSQQN